jgi:hypothetical protein
LLGTFLIVGLVAAAWGFLALWNSEALEIYWQEAKSLSLRGNFPQGIAIESSNVTVTVEDYSVEIEPQVIHIGALLVHYSPPNASSEHGVDLSRVDLSYYSNNSYHEQLAHNLTFSGYMVKYFYGDQQIAAPFVLSRENVSQPGPMFPLRITVATFAKTVITFHYSYVWPDKDPITVYLLPPQLISSISPLSPNKATGAYLTTATSFAQWTLQSLPLRPIMLPIAAFVLCGVCLAVAAGSGRTVSCMTDAYSYLTSDSRKLRPDKLQIELRTLFSNLNMLNHRLGVFLVPALTLFKVMIRERLIFLNNKNKYESPDQDAGLQKFLEDDSAKPSSALLDFKSIALVTGFLASTGIVLSWNVGAMGPLILSLGLLYLCYNLGFMLVIVRRNRKDLLTVVSIIVFVIIVISAPYFLEHVRRGIPYGARIIRRGQ